jgi:predicted nucleotidyltransferase
MRTDKSGQSALLLLDVVEILRREKVDYAIIGAFALSVLGVVRATMDADALLFAEPGRLARLEKKFQQKGFATELRTAEADDPVSGMLVLRDDFGNHVELLGGLRNMDPEILSRTLQINFRGQKLRIVGREDFIAMKCYAGGPQDILDARSAYWAAPGPIDLDLLRTVTRRFGREAADRLQEVLAVQPAAVGPQKTQGRSIE